MTEQQKMALLELRVELLERVLAKAVVHLGLLAVLVAGADNAPSGERQEGDYQSLDKKDGFLVV